MIDMQVRFHVALKSIQGFRRVNMDSLVVPGCSYDLNADEVTRYITSPGYPRNYQPSTLCTWVLRAPEGQRVSFDILNIYLEHQSSCSYDYVAAYDGKNPVNTFWYASTGPVSAQCCWNLAVLSHLPVYCEARNNKHWGNNHCILHVLRTEHMAGI